MDNTTALASAAIGAVVAVVASVVTSRVQKVTDSKSREGELQVAFERGMERGWFEGRESVFQRFQEAVKPEDFAEPK